MKQNLLTKYLDNKKLTIIVDIREQKAKVVEELKKIQGIDIIFKQLPVGDYIISDRVVIERKKEADFIHTITDGRFHKQLEELKRNFEKPLILVEGKDLYRYDIHPNAIRGALLSILIDYGIPILFANDSKDAAQLLYILARREQQELRREVRLRGEKKPKEIKEIQRYILEGLPGVSSKLADRLLRHFGSVEKVILASEDQLMKIEGIGSKKARIIKKVLKAKYMS